MKFILRAGVPFWTQRGGKTVECDDSSGRVYWDRALIRRAGWDRVEGPYWRIWCADSDELAVVDDFGALVPVRDWIF